MGIIELLLIAVGLSMDAFAVCICKGLTMKKIDGRDMFLLALFFGAFQAGMPLLGYFLASSFARYITSVDHWIAFGLLVLIGGKMIFDAIREKQDDTPVNTYIRVGVIELVLLAIATSIDALAVGITFALLPGISIAFSVITIGIVTFVFSLAGVTIGHFFGSRFEKHAQILGGVILILIGLKILLEHLGLLPF